MYANIAYFWTIILEEDEKNDLKNQKLSVL